MHILECGISVYNYRHVVRFWQTFWQVMKKKENRSWELIIRHLSQIVHHAQTDGGKLLVTSTAQLWLRTQREFNNCTIIVSSLIPSASCSHLNVHGQDNEHQVRPAPCMVAALSSVYSDFHHMDQ